MSSAALARSPKDAERPAHGELPRPQDENHVESTEHYQRQYFLPEETKKGSNLQGGSPYASYSTFRGGSTTPPTAAPTPLQAIFLCSGPRLPVLQPRLALDALSSLADSLDAEVYRAVENAWREVLVPSEWYWRQEISGRRRGRLDRASAFDTVCRSDRLAPRVAAGGYHPLAADAPMADPRFFSSSSSFSALYHPPYAVSSGDSGVTMMASSLRRVPHPRQIGQSFYPTRHSAMVGLGYSSNSGRVVLASDKPAPSPTCTTTASGSSSHRRTTSESWSYGAGQKVFTVMHRSGDEVNQEGESRHAEEIEEDVWSRRRFENGEEPPLRRAVSPPHDPVRLRVSTRTLAPVPAFVKAIPRVEHRNLYVLVDEAAAVDPFVDLDFSLASLSFSPEDHDEHHHHHHPYPRSGHHQEAGYQAPRSAMSPYLAAATARSSSSSSVLIEAVELSLQDTILYLNQQLEQLLHVPVQHVVVLTSSVALLKGQQGKTAEEISRAATSAAAAAAAAVHPVPLESVPSLSESESNAPVHAPPIETVEGKLSFHVHFRLADRAVLSSIKDLDRLMQCIRERLEQEAQEPHDETTTLSALQATKESGGVAPALERPKDQEERERERHRQRVRARMLLAWIDFGVYTRWRAFRLPYNVKAEKTIVGMELAAAATTAAAEEEIEEQEQGGSSVQDPTHRLWWQPPLTAVGAIAPSVLFQVRWIPSRKTHGHCPPRRSQPNARFSWTSNVETAGGSLSHAPSTLNPTSTNEVLMAVLGGEPAHWRGDHHHHHHDDSNQSRPWSLVEEHGDSRHPNRNMDHPHHQPPPHQGEDPLEAEEEETTKEEEEEDALALVALRQFLFSARHRCLLPLVPPTTRFATPSLAALLTRLSPWTGGRGRRGSISGNAGGDDNLAASDGFALEPALQNFTPADAVAAVLRQGGPPPPLPVRLKPHRTLPLAVDDDDDVAAPNNILLYSQNTTSTSSDTHHLNNEKPAWASSRVTENTEEAAGAGPQRSPPRAPRPPDLPFLSSAAVNKLFDMAFIQRDERGGNSSSHHHRHHLARQPQDSFPAGEKMKPRKRPRETSANGPQGPQRNNEEEEEGDDDEEEKVMEKEIAVDPPSPVGPAAALRRLTFPLAPASSLLHPGQPSPSALPFHVPRPAFGPSALVPVFQLKVKRWLAEVFYCLHPAFTGVYSPTGDDPQTNRSSSSISRNKRPSCQVSARVCFPGGQDDYPVAYQRVLPERLQVQFDKGAVRGYYVVQKQNKFCLKQHRCHRSTYSQLYLTYGSIKVRCYANDCYRSCVSIPWYRPPPSTTPAAPVAAAASGSLDFTSMRPTTPTLMVSDSAVEGSRTAQRTASRDSGAASGSPAVPQPSPPTENPHDAYPQYERLAELHRLLFPELSPEELLARYGTGETAQTSSVPLLS